MCIAVSLRERGVRGIEPLTYKGYETPTNQSLSVAAYHGRTPEPEGKIRSLPVREPLHPSGRRRVQSGGCQTANRDDAGLVCLLSKVPERIVPVSYTHLTLPTNSLV